MTSRRQPSSQRSRPRLARLGFTLSAVVLTAALIAGCGSDDSSAESDKRVKKLERELNQLQADQQAENEASTAPAGDAQESTTGLDLLGTALFNTYATREGAWSGEVPTGGEWGSGVETQLNPGLHRTTFEGPGGTILIIDATFSENPSFSGDAARTPVDSPDPTVFAGLEKVVFSGDSSLSPCKTAQCVDILMPFTGANAPGGYAVLAGGPAELSQLEQLAETVASTIAIYEG